jgi:predicted dinucleotide-binding enzyme
MSIGIIGAGAIGAAIAKALAKANIPATIANSRGPQSLAALIADLGGPVTAGTVAEAAAADVVFVAVPWSKLPAALDGLGPWNGRIVVDANNAIGGPAFQPVDLGGRVSSAVVADMVPGARVVKAFNHLRPALLSGDPKSEGGRRVLFLSGDDEEAKAEITALMTRLGFFGVDLGTPAGGGQLAAFPGGSLPTLNLVKFD